MRLLGRILTIVNAISEPLKLHTFLEMSESKLKGGGFVLTREKREAERIQFDVDKAPAQYVETSKELDALVATTAWQLFDAKNDPKGLKQIVFETLE